MNKIQNQKQNQNQNQNHNHKIYMNKLYLNILNACKDDDTNININPEFTIEIDERENLIKVISKRNKNQNVNISTSVLYEGSFFIPYFEELKEKDISKKLIEKFIHYAYTVEIHKYL